MFIKIVLSFLLLSFFLGCLCGVVQRSEDPGSPWLDTGKLLLKAGALIFSLLSLVASLGWVLAQVWRL